MKKVAQLANAVFRPVYEQFPLFIIFAFLISQTAIKSLVAGITQPQIVFPTIGYLTLSFFISFIATLLVYSTRSKMLKVVFYTFGFSFYYVYLFLWLVFGTSLSPLIVLIIGETNGSETSEFLQSFLLSKGGIFALLGFLVTLFLAVLFEKKWPLMQKKISNARPTKAAKPAFIVALSMVILSGIFKSRIYYSLFKVSDTKELEIWCMVNEQYYSMDMVTTLCLSLKGLLAISNDILKAKDCAKAVYKQEVLDANKDTTLNVIYI